MRRTVRTVVAAAGALLLCGHALGEEVRIPRKGSSPGFYPSRAIHSSPALLPFRQNRRSDSAECRDLASKPSGDEAGKELVVGYLIGGLLGALIASSANDKGYDSPGRTSSREAYDRCMAKRGSADDD